MKIFNPNNEGLGIDLGIKEFAICSNSNKFKNINKTSTVKKVEKKLKREQRKLSRKYEGLRIINKKKKEEILLVKIFKSKQSKYKTSSEKINIYKCDCGLTIDKDLNASINLKNAKKYKIA